MSISVESHQHASQQETTSTDVEAIEQELRDLEEPLRQLGNAAMGDIEFGHDHNRVWQRSARLRRKLKLISEAEQS